jgi:hypothetical protein
MPLVRPGTSLWELQEVTTVANAAYHPSEVC